MSTTPPIVIPSIIKIAQEIVEIVHDPGQEIQVSQTCIEHITEPPSNLEVSQEAIEYMYRPATELQVSQTLIEVIFPNIGNYYVDSASRTNFTH